MNEKILLVDDEPSLIKLVSKRLEVEGYQVTTAEDGYQALQKIQSSPPDLVILDVMLPKMDGYEVCRQVRGNPKFYSIPIILFTAKILMKDETIGFNAGADSYIRKPFRASELLTEIRKLLDKR